MRRTYVLSLLVVLVVASTAAYAAGWSFDAIQSGAQEVPEVITDTRSRLDLDFNRAFTQARFDLRVADGEDVTVAHLHCGRAGQNGPPVFFLYDGPTVDVDGRLSRGVLRNEDYTGNDCIAAIGRPVNNIASLAFAALDGLIYVNVHTVGNPGGEVRGQLEHVESNGGHGDDDSEDDDSSDDQHTVEVESSNTDDQHPVQPRLR